MLLNSFESIEYLPPNNEVYREYLSSSRPASVTMRWVAMGLIGFSVGTVGFLNKTLIDYITAWRISYLFARVLNEARGTTALERVLSPQRTKAAAC